MLKKIEDKEIMTVWEASKKYRTKYMCMIITEAVDEYGGDNDRGYVIYTADSHGEIYSVPREELRGKTVEFMPGDAAEPLQVGGYVLQ